MANEDLVKFAQDAINLLKIGAEQMRRLESKNAALQQEVQEYQKIAESMEVRLKLEDMGSLPHDDRPLSKRAEELRTSPDYEKLASFATHGKAAFQPLGKVATAASDVNPAGMSPLRRRVAQFVNR